MNSVVYWIASLLDYPLGWLLALPRDAAILIISVGTSLLLTLVRRRTTNQDQLRRCRNDVRRLKQLIREAKRAKDKPAVRRMRSTLATVNAVRLKAELKPLLAAIVPILLLAIWAIERLDYIPPRAHEELTVRAYYPVSSVGRLTHMVPPDAMEMRSEAIQVVEIDPIDRANGVASWTLRPAPGSDSSELVIRHQGQAVRHVVRVGGRIYAPPVAVHNGGRILATEVVLRRVKFLGIVPGIPAIGFPPWLVAYLIIVIPLVPVSRRLLKVY